MAASGESTVAVRGGWHRSLGRDAPVGPVAGGAGIAEEAVDVVLTGADHGIERGFEQDYKRALPVAEAMREDVLLAYEMNGCRRRSMGLRFGWSFRAGTAWRT